MSQITTPTGSIPNAYNRYLRIPGPQQWYVSFLDISVALAILLLKKKKHQNEAEYVMIIIVFTFNKFPIGVKENLQEKDNLSTGDNWPVPNVPFIRRFYCIPGNKTSEFPS